MKIGVLIQARLGSTRLPEKILLPFTENESLIDFVLARLHKIPSVKVIVATTTNRSDDKLVTYLKDKSELLYRGSENDVLERFIGAAEYHNVDGIIRICSDNPFLDFDALTELVNSARINSDMDYISFRINDKPSILTHFGFWGEYVSLNALKKVSKITLEKSAHEHVTYYIYNHPEFFKCHWLTTPDFLQGREDIRLTIDTIEDLDNARKLHQVLSTAIGDYNLKDIVEYLNTHVDLTESMSRIINENIKK